ncbi:hypothetical protein IIA95_01875 [Patescibacteria group bacterium]|nr:hypothetical protein [Patescibacteria group bacterium]
MAHQGFVQFIVIFVLLLVILSLLGVSLSSLLQNKTLKENFSFVFNFLRLAWEKWLAGPVLATWDFTLRIMTEFVGEPILKVLERIKP